MYRYSEWFGRGIIRSCAKLDYGTAQRVIEARDDGRTGVVELEAGCGDLSPWSFAVKMYA